MHPILFEVPTPWGALPVYSFGALLGLTLALGWGVVSRSGQRAGYDKDVLANAFLIGAVGALLGARLLYVATNLEAFGGVGDWLAVQQGGMAAYGAVLGGFASSAVYLRLKRASVLGFADLCAPVLALAVLLTRVGCYLDGSDFGALLGDGAPAWLAALGTFPHWPEATGLRGSPAYLWHVEQTLREAEALSSLPVHPTQLYEAVLGAGLLALAEWKGARRRFSGQVFLTVLLTYGTVRFFIDNLRDDPERGVWLGFSSAQWVAFVLLPAAALAYSVLNRNARAAAAAPAASPADAALKRAR
jgi:phosphatidylglycerol:prolipoprotein diacylglycerol transferase